MKRGGIEATCGRCGGPNIVWHAPSPLWNAVMRGLPPQLEDQWPIICPPCFAELAEQEAVVDPGIVIWCLRPDQGVIAELATRDGGGRRWDPERCLWVEP